MGSTNFNFHTKLMIVLVPLIAMTSNFQIECKGGGGGAAAAGGAVNSISDFSGGSTTGNYTEEEMRMALIILSVILSIFLAILCCQCYQKVVYELIQNNGNNGVHCGHPNEDVCREEGCKQKYSEIPENEGKPLPCAPYSRQTSMVTTPSANYNQSTVVQYNDWNSRRSSQQFVVIPNAINTRDSFCQAHLV